MTVSDIVGSEDGDRVVANTDAEVNARIRRQMEASLCYFAQHPEQIGSRLAELEREWDIERTLEANAASFSLLGMGLGLMAGRRWLALPVGVAAFLLQHAVQGWCPPLALFRRLGVRTAREIEQERYGLKCLRGDFSGDMRSEMAPPERVRRALAAVTR